MSQTISTFNPKIILAIGAHPDDLEDGAGGSIAKWTRQGVKVHFLICTDGCKGTNKQKLPQKQLIKIRRIEQESAVKILGVESVTFLDYEDCSIVANDELKRDITKIIRTLKPDTVITQDPAFLYNARLGLINHIDHRQVATAVMDAVYPLARDHLSFPDLTESGYAPHKVTELLFMSYEPQNLYIDISETYEAKLNALRAYKSQSHMQEVCDMANSTSKVLGAVAGIDRAEAFIRLRLFI